MLKYNLIADTFFELRRIDTGQPIQTRCRCPTRCAPTIGTKLPVPQIVRQHEKDVRPRIAWARGELCIRRGWIDCI